MFGMESSIGVLHREAQLVMKRVVLNEIFCIIMVMSLLTETVVATLEH
jgi:hypothetical protein